MRYQVRTRRQKGQPSKLLFTCKTEEMANALAAGAGVPTVINTIRDDDA